MTGHELYKCATGYWSHQQVCFSISISFVHNYSFLVCNILLKLYVAHVLCCICKFHLLAMSGFNVRLVNVQFLSSSLVCFAWVVFSDYFITKSCYYQAKIFAGLVICVLATPLFSFSRAVNFILFTYSFLIAQQYQCARKKY